MYVLNGSEFAGSSSGGFAYTVFFYGDKLFFYDTWPTKVQNTHNAVDSHWEKHLNESMLPYAFRFSEQKN